MKIALLGDMALIGRYDRKESSDVSHRIKAIKDIVSECDYVIANLESPLTSIKKTRVCKGVYLRSDPENVETLKEIGVTHVTLANNHVFDYGKKGVEETIHILLKAGIKYVGLNNPPEKLIEADNAVLLDGFCCLSANAAGYGKKIGQVKMLSREEMDHFFRIAEKEHSFPVVSVHFGIEGVHYPSVEHLRLFRRLAKEYDYILHGNHPHAVQGYESIGESLLVYAQGNLFFDETPITSFHSIPKETLEERKSYISIVTIEHNVITSNQTIPVSDLPAGFLHIDESVGKELEGYVSALFKNMSEIQKMRSEELKSRNTATQIHDFQFFLDRFNYKYIGAYINGKKHAKQYNEIFRNFKDSE